MDIVTEQLAVTFSLSSDNSPLNYPVLPHLANLLADYAGGSLQAVIAIVSALYARVSSGRRKSIDISLSDRVLSLLGPEVAAYAASGRVPFGGEKRGSPVRPRIITCARPQTADSSRLAATNRPSFESSAPRSNWTS